MKKSLDTLYCENCGSTNVQATAWCRPNDDNEFVDYYGWKQADDNWCDDCEEHVALLTLPELWERFKYIALTESGNITQDFLHFKAGTCRADVEEWFAERCPNGIGDLTGDPEDWDAVYTAYCRDCFLFHKHEGESTAKAFENAYYETTRLNYHPYQFTPNPINQLALERWKSVYGPILFTLKGAERRNDFSNLRLCGCCSFPVLNGYCYHGWYACTARCYNTLFITREGQKPLEPIKQNFQSIKIFKQ